MQLLHHGCFGGKPRGGNVITGWHHSFGLPKASLAPLIGAQTRRICGQLFTHCHVRISKIWELKAQPSWSYPGVILLPATFLPHTHLPGKSCTNSALGRYYGTKPLDFPRPDLALGRRGPRETRRSAPTPKEVGPLGQESPSSCPAGALQDRPWDPAPIGPKEISPAAQRKRHKAQLTCLFAKEKGS